MRFLTISLAAMLVATQAFAHPGAGVPSGMATGFLHPFGGLDHILAMVAVGLLAVQRGGRALWLVPGAFLAIMAVGGAAGILGVTLSMVELGIALSIVVTGGLVVLGKRLPLAVAATFIGLFAAFHGHAHGAEMPGVVSGLTFGLGFMTATALLIGGGIVAGFGLHKASVAHGIGLARAGGAALCATGVVILTSLL